jgi:hypothetical protein
MTGLINPPNRPKGRLLLLLAVLCAALCVVCKEGFLPHRIMWANDSPLGQLKSISARLPDTFTGHWGTDYWIGTEIPSSSPTLATLLATVISPELYMKIFTPLTMVLLGFSAWLLFRQLGFSAMACVLGGLAAGLNMHFFSVACWGLGTWNICCAMIFLAFAALVTPNIRQGWIKAALAGLAVGMSVMEGFDSGAILSVYVGVFLLFFCLTTESNPAQGVAKSAMLGIIMVFMAVFVAASTLSTLVGTQIKGIGGMGQTKEEKQQHWDFTTQWSVPKIETLRIMIPGIFGYRMVDYTTSPDKSGVYWGSIAEDSKLADLESGDPETRKRTAAALRAPPDVIEALGSSDQRTQAAGRDRILGGIPLQRRHSGNGEYAGVLVALMAVFAVANSFRKDSPYSNTERRLVWFFAGAALFSLVAAWGRHAPLYALLYQLPYFSTIRNPLKFMHPFHITWIILAGFGFEAIYRCYVRPALERAGVASSRLKAGWKLAPGFDKKWVTGLCVFMACALVSILIVSGEKNDIVEFLMEHGFGPDVAPGMAAFSFAEVCWFVAFSAAFVTIIILLAGGAFREKKGVWTAVSLLAVLCVCDLARSDRPWVRYFDYEQKYSMNPITDFLRNKPYEHRVGAKLTPRDGYYALAGQEQSFGGICHWWLENDFPYNNIQSVDIDQMPRTPVWDEHYLNTFMPANHDDLWGPVRLWKLTNTRYILMLAGLVPVLNERGDPAEHGCQIRALFEIAAKPGVGQVEDGGDVMPVQNDKGPFALVEITNALPRVKLYSNWRVMEENDALRTLATPTFDPRLTVLVDKTTPVDGQPGAPTAEAGPADIVDYNPKDVKLKASPKAPAVLLLNGRTADAWKAFVDGKPEKVLRCNYLMRGVFLAPGDHNIEFRFEQSLRPLYVSLSAFAVGLALMIYLIVSHWRERNAPVA